MRRCYEWVVYMKGRDSDPESFVTPECWRTKRKEEDGPALGAETAVQLPTAGVDAYEGGFGLRKGWSGRSWHDTNTPN
ncbi:transposase [Bifidobacterium eulemuris]|uniref:Transposase n=1 Tax=Bifidobacterium eulemuris TaxID=1765219 RepID=A0A261G3R5_9BIFI|nr:transposase [Bifidobacterium eulemuris]